MGSTERRAREKEEMRSLIARAAMKLFLSEGFEKTSIRRIADEIEYTPGAIYSYFKDKDEILYLLHTEGMDRLYEALREANDIEDPAVALRTCCRNYVQFALQNREYYDMMFIMDATGNKIREKNDWVEGMRTYDVLRRVVYRCMQAGVLMPGHPEAAAFSLWSFVHGMVALNIRHRCPMFTEESLATMVEGASDYLMQVLKAAAVSTPLPEGQLPEFVAMAGLTAEGVQHLRAFAKPGATAPASGVTTPGPRPLKTVPPKARPKKHRGA